MFHEGWMFYVFLIKDQYFCKMEEKNKCNNHELE
jgi:hypothetical protein